MKKWYQDWRNLITILLLVFAPTYLIGIIVMWLATSWSKRTKWWVTGVGLGIPLFGILISLLLTLVLSGKQSSTAKDTIRRAGVQEISTQARRFCLDLGSCPSNILELQQRDYLGEIPVDPDTKLDFFYQLTNNGKDCVVKTLLSTKEEFSRTCTSSYTP